MKKVSAGALVLSLLLCGPAVCEDLAGSAYGTRHMPYDAFDQLPATALKVKGATLHVAFAPGLLELPRERFLSWIEKSAKAVSIYYGRFPVSSARVLIVPVEGKGADDSQAFSRKGAAIRSFVGRETTESDLLLDWQLVHEMIHLALPEVGDEHLWLAEGLAVYIEPIARVQAGDLTEAKIWGEFVRDMPQGLPQEGDAGLDHTHTWGRTYWGGAIFCLLADIEIRKRTANAKGLQEAVRGVLDAGGDMEKDWPIERVFAVADQAAGAPILGELYEKTRAAPAPINLEELWTDLGIRVHDGMITFDDDAPLAAIRRAITQNAGKAGIMPSLEVGSGETPREH